MKQIIKLAVFFLIVVCVFASCIKDKPATSSPISNNKPPIANAGIDQIIILPTDSVELSGSGTDPDGNIVSYSWSQISGPSLFIIVNPNIAVIKIKYLLVGVYEFELKVTDNGGLSATDKVIVKMDAQVTINTLQLIPVGTLSINRTNSAAATSGNKLLFAGGGFLSSRVDIYDLITQTWSTAELSEARTGIGAVTVGNKILFAGGAKNFNWDDGWYDLSTRVDIYDVSTNSWTITELPAPINFLWWEGAVAAVGNKAFFCGNRQDTVYIYDVISNSWSTAKLSVNRSDLAATSVGNKLLIAGGMSNNVDIYDASSNTWSVNSLSQIRKLLRAATLNSKVFFAGGRYTNKVDIYDNATQSWSVGTLRRPSGGLSTVLCGGAASMGQKMLFFGGDLVDIYDYNSNTWSISSIAQYAGVNHTFCDNSTIIAAGGNVYATNWKEVWRIQF